MHSLCASSQRSLLVQEDLTDLTTEAWTGEACSAPIQLPCTLILIAELAVLNKLKTESSESLLLGRQRQEGL